MMFWITGILGLALAVAPWVFSYSDNSSAMWTSVILGAIILLASAYKGLMQDTQQWEYWIAGLAGVLALVAPFVLGFTALTAALWTAIIVGALVVVLSGYQVLTNQEAV